MKVAKEEAGWKKMGNSGDTLYAFGLIGAAVYFLQRAGSFQEGVMGILKAFVWPALLVYNMLGFLKM